MNKTYKITFTQSEDGILIEAESNGFNHLEKVGLVSILLQNVINKKTADEEEQG